MFRPPHCPNPECPNHFRPQGRPWYRFYAFYTTKAFGKVPRFLCTSCRKTFSSQTFRLDYYAKKRLDYRFLFQQFTSASGLRNIARNLGVRVETVANRLDRLARNAILAHEQLLLPLSLQEDLALDGFESFCGSQYHPDNTHFVVGKDSQFVYALDYVSLRRKGRMTEKQKRRRAELESLWKPPPKAVERSFGDLIRWVLERSWERRRPIILYTDEKPDYLRALKRDPVCRQAFFCGLIRHHRTNSREIRNHRNPLFPVNYIDREVRKDVAAHGRETVKFNRDVGEGVFRLALYLFDHNYFKPYRIGQGRLEELRHSDLAGVSREKADRWAKRFFTDRFFWREREHELKGAGRKTLDQRWVTPIKGSRRVFVRHLAA